MQRFGAPGAPSTLTLWLPKNCPPTVFSGTAVAAPDCMLSVLGVFAFVWACLIFAICAICAAAGAADEQSEEWYREHKRMVEDVDRGERGAA